MMTKPYALTVKALTRDAVTSAGITMSDEFIGAPIPAGVSRGDWVALDAPDHKRVWWTRGERIATEQGVVKVVMVVSVLWKGDTATVTVTCPGIDDVSMSLPIRSRVDDIRGKVVLAAYQARVAVEKLHRVLPVGTPVLFEKRTTDYPGHRWTAYAGEVIRHHSRTMTGDSIPRNVRVSIGMHADDSTPEVCVINPVTPDDTADISGVVVTDANTVEWLDMARYSREYDYTRDAIECAQTSKWGGFGLVFGADGGTVRAREERDGVDGGHVCTFALAVAQTEAILSAGREIDPDGIDIFHGSMIAYDVSNPFIRQVVERLAGADAATFETRMGEIENAHARSALINTYDIPEEHVSEVLRALHDAGAGDCEECGGWDVDAAFKSAGFGRCADCSEVMENENGDLPEDAICLSCAENYGTHGDGCECYSTLLDGERHGGHVLTRAEFEALDDQRCPSAPEYGTREGGPDPEGEVWTLATAPGAGFASALNPDVMVDLLGREDAGRGYRGNYTPNDGAGNEVVRFSCEGAPSGIYTRPRA